MTDDIRKQIKGARVFAALSMTTPTHHLCGIKVELLTDTMESLLTRNEALERVLEAARRIRKFPSSSSHYRTLDHTIADCNTEQGN